MRKKKLYETKTKNPLKKNSIVGILSHRFLSRHIKQVPQYGLLSLRESL